MTTMIPTKINGKWWVTLPEHRAARPEWVTGWERERLDSMHDYLTHITPGRRPVIIDVGAEEGDMPALYSMWGCDVVLIEPNPKVWPNIKAIWEANELRAPLINFVGFAAEMSHVAPYRDSVGGKGLIGQDGWPFCARDEVIGDHGFRHLAQQADETPCITIDDLVGDQHIDAITMDVEGSELRVVVGAAKVLERDHPLVWVSCHTDYEWNDKWYEGVRVEQVIDAMGAYNYEAVHICNELHEDHWLFR